MAIVSGGEVVLAESTPTMFRTNSYPLGGESLSGFFASYAAIYRAQLWVYVLVNKRAKATARLPLKVYRRAVGGRDDARDTPYGRLLANPNPRMSPFRFWEWVSSTYDVNGDAMVVKVRGRDGLPRELWPLHPTNTAIVVDPDTREISYEVYSGSSRGVAPVLVIPARDVIHFRTFNPDSTLRGVSAMEPLRQTILNEDAVRRASQAFWANGARPSTYLSHPNKLSPEALKRLKGQWDDIHGGVDNFAKTAILEEGMEPHTLSLSAEEAQFIQTKHLNREEVCAAYDVPPPVVHILDRATFSNITEQMRSLYRDTMAPHLSAFEADLDTQLRPEFDAKGDLYAEFLMDDVLRGSFEARQEAYQKADYMMLSEKRRAENLPYVKGSDVILVNGAYVPLELAGHTHQTEPLAGQEPASDQQPSPAPVPTRSLSAQVAEKVTKRVARRAVLGELDVDALTAGLNGSTRSVLEVLEKSLTAGDTPSQFCERLWALVKEDA